MPTAPITVRPLAPLACTIADTVHATTAGHLTIDQEAELVMALVFAVDALDTSPEETSR